MSTELLADQIRDLKKRVTQLEALEVPQYATGTWTPTYSGASTAGTTTYTTQVGSYTRIGNMVAFTAYVAWTAATGTGVAQISLPFTTQNTTNLRLSAAVFHTGVTFSGSGVMAFALPNSNQIQFYSPLSNAVRADVTVEAAGDIVVSGVFFI